MEVERPGYPRGVQPLMPVDAHTDEAPELLVDLRLPPHPTSPARARRALNPLKERFSEGILFKLRLLLSELVTNSVRHARLQDTDYIVVRVLCEPGALRAEVLDAGRRVSFPAMMVNRAGWQYQRTRGSDWPGGWGLSMVEALADSWGVTRDLGTTVWFELGLMGA
jgi:anti-sigma regulatory factor (Ser/Thr protein kinase)